MTKIIYVSVESIFKDLVEINEKIGEKFVLALLANLISENSWWIWPEMKNEILNNPELLRKD